MASKLELKTKPSVATAVGGGNAQQLALSLSTILDEVDALTEGQRFHLNQLVEILCGEELIGD